MTDGFTEEQHESSALPRRPDAEEAKTTAIAVPGRVPDGGAGPRVVLLGADELSRELTVALRNLGADVIPVDESHGPDELSKSIHAVRADFVVTATDAVGVGALAAGAGNERTEWVPSARALRLTADREGLRRLAADELGLPTAPFWFAGSVGELEAVAAHAGYPLLVKPVVGPGRSLVSGPGDVGPAWQRAVGGQAGPQRQRVLAETVVEVEFHVTLLVVRTEGPNGPVIDFCSPIGHRAAGVDGVESWQPQKLSTAATDACRSIAARIVKALGGRGVFGVELMISGDEVYFADVTPRPHDSAWVTLRSQRLSAFELLARTILGLPVDTIMISPAAACVVGPGRSPSAAALSAALSVPESDLRLSQRVALATAPEVGTARERAREAAARLNVRDSRG